MSFLDIDVSNAEEPKAVPGGEEYKIRISGAITNINKNGNPYFMPRFDIVDHPKAKDLTDYIALPYEGMSEKDRVKIEWKIKMFKSAFEIPLDGSIELDDLIGKEAWAILSLKEDEAYGEQNGVSKYIAPK